MGLVGALVASLMFLFKTELEIISRQNATTAFSCFIVKASLSLSLSLSLSSISIDLRELCLTLLLIHAFKN